MVVTLILIGIILVAVIIIILLFNSRSKLKKEVQKDEKEIKHDEHLIHALEDVMQKDGKIMREANEKRDKIADGDAVSVANALNKL